MGARLEMVKPNRAGTRRTLLGGVAVPLPPTVNTYWRHKPLFSPKHNRWMAVVYKTHKGKEYAQLIRNLMLERKAWYYSENPLHLRLLMCFQDERENDVDNRIKPVQDALAYGGVYKNDHQVKIVEAREGPKVRPATCFIWLDEFIPDTAANLRWIQNPVG